METKIIISDILKDMSNSFRLYSPRFGICTFFYLSEDTNDIWVKKHNGVTECFISES